MKKNIIGYDRASLLDLAIIAGGCIDCVFEFAALNSMSVTDDVLISRCYDASGLSMIDSEALKQVDIEEVRPATAIRPEDVPCCPCGGIGYMGVEIDFEVS